MRNNAGVLDVTDGLDRTLLAAGGPARWATGPRDALAEAVADPSTAPLTGTPPLAGAGPLAAAPVTGAGPLAAGPLAGGTPSATAGAGQVVAILTDPAVIRIGWLAAGISTVVLAVAALL
ncbi:hypothetical protein [Couchioplanes azureus]|uniref:hypothetical protein n=1 Tax=Couchioplanes caeruleus TaxID=56438 RepID=UPI0016716E74|nr:hypothetical protein [Couchioplanes caeruleus]GGQ40259.1 hypothetical protein GCM10010166_04100 [Couchioplanes caeruleus subsp. azureus]